MLTFCKNLRIVFFKRYHIQDIVAIFLMPASEHHEHGKCKHQKNASTDQNTGNFRCYGNKMAHKPNAGADDDCA